MKMWKEQKGFLEYRHLIYLSNCKTSFFKIKHVTFGHAKALVPVWFFKRSFCSFLYIFSVLSLLTKQVFFDMRLRTHSFLIFLKAILPRVSLSSLYFIKSVIFHWMCLHVRSRLFLCLIVKYFIMIFLVSLTAHKWETAKTSFLKIKLEWVF